MLEFVPANSKIWCPCDKENSAFVQLFREKGHTVIASHIEDGKDFLTYESTEKYDYIITNPPFSLKDKILKRCYELGKPFALLLPVPTIQGMTAFVDFAFGYDIEDQAIDRIAEVLNEHNIPYKVIEDGMVLEDFMICACGNTTFVRKPKGPHIGLYCADCDKWVKWIPKEANNDMGNSNINGGGSSVHNDSTGRLTKNTPSDESDNDEVPW